MSAYQRSYLAKSFFADPAYEQQLFRPGERAVRFAKSNDPFGKFGADVRNFFKVSCGRGIDIDRVVDRFGRRQYIGRISVRRWPLTGEREA